MSAYTQNYVYQFGKKVPEAKENIMSKEKLDELCKSAEKYMVQEKHESEKRTAKQ